MATTPISFRWPPITNSSKEIMQSEHNHECAKVGDADFESELATIPKGELWRQRTTGKLEAGLSRESSSAQRRLASMRPKRGD